jgi:dihydrofolate reductase
MRTLFAFEMISLDGFFEGPNQDISWHTVDDEFNKFAGRQLDTVDGLLFGRKTYQLMALYWPTATGDDPVITLKMNVLPKFVFSRTMEKAEWNNTRLIRENAAEEILKLKQARGKDLALFGSAALLSTLAQANLVDEYRIMVNPILLGKGTPLFQGMDRRMNLKLISSNTYRSGNVLLCYRPNGSGDPKTVTSQP